MEHFNIRAGENKYVVEADVVICGKDINICIGGGEVYHIGASALAIPRKSLADKEGNSASASVLCVVGHKEDELARNASLELSTLFQCRVNITVGMHIEHATKDDIKALYKNFERVLYIIKDRVSSKHRN